MLRDMVERAPHWLSAEGKFPEMVISSRARVARNLEGFLFPAKLDKTLRKGVLKEIKKAALSLPEFRDALIFEISELSDLDRVFLAERHLISLDLLADGEGKAVIISRDETLSLMVNEEDHIRLQAFAPGLNLEEVFEKVLQVEQKLGETLSYAYREPYGFLTSCPTNTGTGLRLSVLLHLAGIVYSKQLEGLLRNLAKVKVSVRGLYGEGTNVEGNVFQISSLLSLGVSEKETLESFRDVVEITLDFEKKSREILLENMKEALEDKIQRSLAILSSARLLSFKETAEYVSAVRLGIGIGKIFDIKVKTLNELLLFSQPAHLQKLFGKEMGPQERDEKRASYVKTKLKAE